MSNENLSQQEQIKKLGEMIHDIDFTMMTTALPDGSLRSRPMSTQKPEKEKFDGTLWFFTGIDSGKVHEIQDDQHVNLAYAEPKSQRYISVSGRAKIVRDQAKIDELWRPEHKAWFPDGKDDPNLGLLQVEIEDAEYWDMPSSTMMHLVGMAKAAVTRQEYEPGENKKISM